jgi:hypothetical protein
MWEYAGGSLKSMTHITVFNRVLDVEFELKSILLNVTTIPLFYVTTISLLDRPYLLSW